MAQAISTRSCGRDGGMMNTIRIAATLALGDAVWNHNKGPDRSPRSPPQRGAPRYLAAVTIQGAELSGAVGRPPPTFEPASLSCAPQPVAGTAGSPATDPRTDPPGASRPRVGPVSRARSPAAR